MVQLSLATSDNNKKGIIMKLTSFHIYWYRTMSPRVMYAVIGTDTKSPINIP
jgi:hypothetical protein